MTTKLYTYNSESGLQKHSIYERALKEICNYADLQRFQPPELCLTSLL